MKANATMKAETNGAAAVKAAEPVRISPPNLQTAEFTLQGTAPLVLCKFSAKAKQAIHNKQALGSQAQKGTKRTARDFQADFEGAVHRGPNGEYGVPANSFRNAMISACRMVGFKMTHAKLSVFVLADFYGDDGSPLVLLEGGDPEYTEMVARNETGVCDLRVRPMWREWSLKLRVRYDADQFSLQDVANLLARAGMQVGIGEGRPDSKGSAGMGWGTFTLV